MNRDRIRQGKSGSGLHALLPAEPERRLSGRLLLFIALAVTGGVIAGVAWLGVPGRGALETLPDLAKQATATAPLATSTQASTAAPAVASPAAAQETRESAATGAPAEGTGPAAGAADRADSTQTGPSSLGLGMSMAQAAALQTATPTATSTPPPRREQIEAVVKSGGVFVYEAESGAPVAELQQGNLFIVTAYTTEGGWIYGTTGAGIAGWVARDELLVFNPEQLRREDVVLMPITPTPTPADGVSGAAAGSTAGGEAGSTAETEAGATTGEDGPTARVDLEDSRLNLRAGPGEDYPVLAKAQPAAVYRVLGRNAAGAWLQLAESSVQGGFAWGAAEYLSVSVPVRTLPVVDAVSDGPAYDGEDSPEAPKGQDTGGVHAPDDDARRDVKVRKAAPATGLQGTLAIQTTWGGDIQLYDLATGDLRLLTGGFDPAISPDGGTIAFTRGGGEQGLYLIDRDGSNERLIFSGRTLLRSPKWSPDGRYIVFERGDEFDFCMPDDNPRRCVPPIPNVDAFEPDELDSETQQKLARVDINGENYRDIPVLARARVPDWNEAGIVYQSPAGIQMTQDDPDAASELVFFNIQKQYELDPDWQPGGGEIIFQRREASHWQIFSVSSDGAGLHALTRPATALVDSMPSNVAPAWSPDGRHIVFLSNRTPENSAGDWRIWAMNADGSNKRQLPIDLPITYTYVAEQMLDWGP